MLHATEDKFRGFTGYNVSRTVTLAPNGLPLRYRAGGKMKMSPSLWLGETRIAFWPQDRKVTSEAVVAVFVAWIESPLDLLGREYVRAAIDGTTQK